MASLLLSLSVVFDFALVCDWVSHRGPFQRYQRTHECGDLQSRRRPCVWQSIKLRRRPQSADRLPALRARCVAVRAPSADAAVAERMGARVEARRVVLHIEADRTRCIRCRPARHRSRSAAPARRLPVHLSQETSPSETPARGRQAYRKGVSLGVGTHKGRATTKRASQVPICYQLGKMVAWRPPCSWPGEEPPPPTRRPPAAEEAGESVSEVVRFREPHTQRARRGWGRCAHMPIYQ